MEEEQIIVGLDIGTTKICVIVGKKNEFGKLEVLGMGRAVSDGVLRGMVTNIGKTVKAINQAVSEAEESSGINIKVVNVGVAGQHIISGIHHGSITRDEKSNTITAEDVMRLYSDMHRIVTRPGSQIIHVMPQDYTVDFETGIKDPIGHSGLHLEADFHIITAQTNMIKNVTDCVKNAGLEIDNLILEPLASSLAALQDEEKEAGVCLVDIGGGTTDIAIFKDNLIRHTAVIPFGGNIITSDIKTGCNIMVAQAEMLKQKFGRSLAESANPNDIVSIPGLRNRPPKEISLRNLAHIIEARMKEIIELVHLEIFRSGYDKQLSCGIVLTGGGSQLADIRPLFEYMTGQDVRIGLPNEHLGKSQFEGVKSPMYSTSVGLVLSGFKYLDEREEDLKNISTNRRKSEKGKVAGFFSNFLDNFRDIILDDSGSMEKF